MGRPTAPMPRETTSGVTDPLCVAPAHRKLLWQFMQWVLGTILLRFTGRSTAIRLFIKGH